MNALGFFGSSQFAANLGNRFGAMPVVRFCVAGFAVATVVLYIVFAMGIGSFVMLVGLLIVANAFLGLVIPTAMVLSLEEHGPIAGTAASLGGTMQMLIGAAAIVGVSAVFDGKPVTMAAVIGLCGVVALIVSLLMLGGRRPAVA